MSASCEKTYRVTFYNSKKSYILTEPDIKNFEIMGIGLEDNYSVEALK